MRGIGFCFLLIISALLIAADSLLLRPKEVEAQTEKQTFPMSLHATRQGKRFWYSAGNGGFEAITGIPIEQLGCLKCHPGTRADGRAIDPATYKPDCSDCHVREGDRVSDQICLKCHRRQGAEMALGYPDVHREKGLGCMSCHTTREMHGDGREYVSWLEPGAMDAACENCHSTVPPNTSHTLHQATVNCTACHARSVLSCDNCHFESQVKAGITRPHGVLRDFVLLVRRKGMGKVYPATMQALTYKGKSFVALAPYRAHTILAKGRECRECHNNEVIQEYVQTGKITVTRWDEAQGRIVNAKGIIPVPPDWQQALKFAFVDYTGDLTASKTDPTKWIFLKAAADRMQILFAEPLTNQQMQKLAQPMEPPESREAQAIAKKIIEETRGVLLKEMGEKGPAGAIQACSAVALELARKHEQQGWRVRRVSLKVRNPADTPDPYEAHILHQFEALKAKGQLGPDTEHVEVVMEEGKMYLRYLKPIVIATPLCLNCHGPQEDLLPEVKTALQTLYPGDQATGYRINDLRGAVSIKIPLEGKP